MRNFSHMMPGARAPSRVLGEAAVDTGDDVLSPDDPGVALDPLGHQLRVLDAVRRVRDDARDDDLPVGT